MPITKIASSSLEENQQNYISILRAGQSVTDTGWGTYFDSAGVNPVDGIGGTATVTWSQNTSNPLSGDADLRLVKDASNRQGDGVSIPFTIANRHLAKVLQISFDMELISGTYASGDLRVSIIQDPSGTPVVLEPVGTTLELGIANQRMREIATFQTHVSVTSYRLCIHVSSTSASAYTVDFANFKVWEQQQSLGAVITDWVSYIPTISGTSSNPTKATNAVESAKWRRVGSQMEIRYSYYHTSTTGAGAGSGDYLWSIPSGFSIDSSVIPNSTSSVQARSHLGEFICSNGGDTNSGQLRAYDSTRLILRFNNGSPASAVGSGAYPFTSTSSMEYSFTAFVPITGWGSNVQLSSDSDDGRVVACRIQDVISGTNTNNGFAWSTTSYDTHSMVRTSGSGATQRTEVVIPVSGYYRVSVSVVFNNTGSVEIYKNGTTSIAYMTYAKNANLMESCSTSVYLLAGDYIYIRSSGAYTSLSGTGAALTVERITAGSQIIASVEGVSASAYIGGANQTTTAGTIVNFNTKWHDTHNAVTTGASWRFTAPMNGKYQISGYLALSNASQRTELRKNGSTFLYGLTRQPAGSNYGGNFSVTLDLISGDFIDIRSTSSTDYYGGTPSSTGEPCYISINRIGI